MLRKIRVSGSVLNYTYLCRLDPNSLCRHRRIVVYLQKNRRVNYTDHRGKSREIQSGMNRRTEYGTRSAIEWAMTYIGYGKPCATGSMKDTEGKYEYSKRDANED